MTKHRKIARHIFWALILATLFFAVWQAGGNRSFQRGFETGYEAASNNISTRIRSGMGEMSPFYIADIGIRFSPRGSAITGLQFVGDEKHYSAKAEVDE